jgi:hypothetical protein
MNSDAIGRLIGNVTAGDTELRFAVDRNPAAGLIDRFATRFASAESCWDCAGPRKTGPADTSDRVRLLGQAAFRGP